MKWTKYVRFSEFGDYCLISNQINNKSFKISYECLNYINEAIVQGIHRVDFVDCFEDNEDRNYINSLVDKLYELYMLAEEDVRLNNQSFNIMWHLTYRCNLLCRHCSVSANNTTHSDLNRSEILSIAQKLAKLNPRMITLSGGEPMMNENFLDVVKEIRKNYKGNLALMTNATLISEENVGFIAGQFTSINISLDGINDETCSQIRGKGVFDRVMKSIKLLQLANNNNLILSMVQTRQNRKFRNEFKDLCKKLNITPLFRYFESIGRGKENENELAVYEDYINEKYNSEKFALSVEPSVFSCKAAISEFLIDDKGVVFPCVMLSDEDFNMGCVLEIEDLKLFLEEEKYKNSKGYQNLTRLMPFNLEHCKQCKYNMICCSCLGEMKANLEHNVFDIKCASMKNSLQRFID